MRDVVVILREWAASDTKLAAGDPVLTRAADEIERLRTVNAGLDAAYVKSEQECSRLRAELQAQKEAARIVAARQQ